MPNEPQTVFITGGGRGIGRAAAVAFAEAGYDICTTARSADDLAKTRDAVEAQGRKCVVFTSDLSDAANAANAVSVAHEQLGRIDVLLNNAGTAALAPIESFGLDQFDETMSLNIRAVFVCCKAVWPIMKNQSGGTIINISSVLAKEPFPGFAVYSASKAAVNALSTALAAEGRPHDIRVFALGPGAVETGMLRGQFPDYPPEQCLQPAEVADFAVLLSDPRSRFATGEHVYLRKT